MNDERPLSAFPPINVSSRGDEHVRLYQETNGAKGYLWNGAPILLVTTKGRKSGDPRTIPIMFTQYGDSFVIIASMGGSPTHPKWYLNVTEDPGVRVQVKADKFDALLARPSHRNANASGWKL